MAKRFIPKLSVILCIAAVILSGVTVRTQAASRDSIDEMIASIPSDWPEAPNVQVGAAILMDADSGEILYAKNATEAMYPASTTKLMTALLTLEYASLQDVVSFSQKAVMIPSGSSHIGMRRGEKMVLRECLYGLLLPSANEVANALAEHVAGAIAPFISLMNERAYQLGAVNTVFTNTNGLHDEGHYTCAYDLALIMQALSTNNTFLEISSAQSYVHHADELLPKDIPMTNTNMMIRRSSEYYNDTVVCGKTGHTSESGYNLVTYAENDGTRLIVVVMGCESGMQYVATQSLLDYGFHYFHQVLPAELDTSLNMENRFTASPLSIPTGEVTLLSVNSGDTILLPDNVTFDQLDKEIHPAEDGILILYKYQDYPLGSVFLSYTAEKELPIVLPKDTSERTARSEPKNLVIIDGFLVVFLIALSGLITGLILFLRNRFRPKNTFRWIK